MDLLTIAAANKYTNRKIGNGKSFFSLTNQTISNTKTFQVKANNYMCMVINLIAKYTTTVPDAMPYIYFEIPGFYQSINHQIGVKKFSFEVYSVHIGDSSSAHHRETRIYDVWPSSEFIHYQWKIPPLSEEYNTCNITIVVPDGVTLYINEFYNSYSDEKKSDDLRLNSHFGVRTIDATAENTIRQYNMVAKCGAKACIVSPYITKDGVIVLSHNRNIRTRALDPNGNKITNDIYIENLTYNELLEYNYGGLNKGYFYPQKIPTVDQFFEICAKTRMAPIFSAHFDDPPDAETGKKAWQTDANWEIVKTKLIKYNLLSKFQVKSWDDEVLQSAARIFGDEIDGYTREDGSDAQPVFINPPFNTFNCRLVIERTLSSWTNYPDLANRVKTKYGWDSASYQTTHDISTGVFENESAEKRGGTVDLVEGTYIYSKPVARIMRISSESDIQNKKMDSIAYKALIAMGVKEFTNDYIHSYGMNW